MKTAYKITAEIPNQSWTKKTVTLTGNYIPGTEAKGQQRCFLIS